MNSLPTVSNISKITAQAIQSYCTTKSQEVKTIICVCVLHNMMTILGLLRLWELLYLLSVSSRVISKHFHLFCFAWFIVDLVFLFFSLSHSLCLCFVSLSSLRCSFLHCWKVAEVNVCRDVFHNNSLTPPLSRGSSLSRALIQPQMGSRVTPGLFSRENPDPCV